MSHVDKGAKVSGEDQQDEGALQEAATTPFETQQLRANVSREDQQQDKGAQEVSGEEQQDKGAQEVHGEDQQEEGVQEAATMPLESSQQLTVEQKQHARIILDLTSVHGGDEELEDSTEEPTIPTISNESITIPARSNTSELFALLDLSRTMTPEVVGVPITETRYSVSTEPTMPVVAVNLQMSVPKGLTRDRLMGSLTGLPDVHRVMVVDPDANAIMAMSVFRAMSSALIGGFLKPNTEGNIQEIAAQSWNQVKDIINRSRGQATVSFTRNHWTINASAVEHQGSRATASIGGPIGNNQACWIPLLRELSSDVTTVWLPGKLQDHDPPSEHQCILMVMETETEMIRAELAWKSDGSRILQCFGGLGGSVLEDGTVHLETGGRFYSGMYALANPAKILYIGGKWFV